MHRGYIKLYRKMKDWEWYGDPNTTLVFFHLLLSVCHKPTKYQGLTLESGSYITTYDEIADTIGLTKDEVIGAFKKLKKTNEVTTQKARNKLLVEVLNYRKYQCSEEAEEPHNSHTVPTQLPYGSHTVPTPIEKESKELKEVKKRDIPPTPKPKKEILVLSEIQKTEEWAGFAEYRKKTKKPLTDRAVTLALNSLENLAPNDLATQKKILDQSVLKGWTGLFKLKEEDDAGYSQSHSKQDATGSTTTHKPRFGIVAGENASG